MARVFGDWINDLDFYKFREFTHEGIPMVIARMGYSRERCYEIFLQDYDKGNDLWELLWKHGDDLSISAGTPNQILRLEAGILSYLSDMDRTNNPYEVGLDWMIDLDQEDDFIGKDALKVIKETGPVNTLMGAEIVGEAMTVFNDEHWPVFIDDKRIGSMMVAAYSPRLKKNISYMIIETAFAIEGQEVIVVTPDAELEAVIVNLPWFKERA
jgi:aminomethyltransferase